MSFVAGDLVKLKSGGPLMTVADVGQDMTGQDMVWCVWSEKVGAKQVVQRETFPPAVLEKASKPGIGAVRITRA